MKLSKFSFVRIILCCTIILPSFSLAKHTFKKYQNKSLLACYIRAKQHEFKVLYHKGQVKKLVPTELVAFQSKFNSRPKEKLKQLKMQIENVSNILIQLNTPYKNQAIENLKNRICLLRSI